MIIKNLGVVEYQTCLSQMQHFTKNRTQHTQDELWLVQHPSVFTQGVKDSSQHLLNNLSNIPIVKTDRGGQITYHGLGQLVLYCLLDIRRQKIGIRQLVELLEQAVIDLLADYNINANRQTNMPGVYVDGAKISALGLKVKHGKTYHGLSLNVDMDLTPFGYINPCGYENLTSTQLIDLSQQAIHIETISKQLTQLLIKSLS